MDTTTTQEAPTALPPALGGVVPYLSLDGAVKAAGFYEKALGAEIVGMHPPDETGRTMHVHLHLNGGSLMLSDAYPEHGHPLQPPQAFSLILPVTNIDALWARAVEAGMQVVMPLQVMFWGDRYGQLKDPYGVLWAMNAPA
jgi:uncharacterized glyoxalase superfamily protein PhnB